MEFSTIIENDMSINLRVLYLFVLSEENTKGNNTNNSNDAEHKPKLNVSQNCFYGIEKPLEIVRQNENNRPQAEGISHLTQSFYLL